MSDWIWTYDDNASDLSVPGDNFDKRMLAYAENAGTITVTVSPPGLESDYYFSEPGQPGADYWPAGWATIKLRTTVGNPRITYEVALSRVNAFGAWQAFYATVGGEGPFQTWPAGTRTHNLFCVAQAANAGDRMRLRIRWTRNIDIGGSDVTFGFGDPTTDTVEVPIEMANSRIVWNGNTLDFPNPLTGYRASRPSRRFVAMSDGKVHETSLRTTFDDVRIRLANFDDVDFEADIVAWWAWARAGNQYAFALDSTDTVDTTLDGAAASGQKVIPLTATAGIVVGNKYKIRQAIGNDEEIVHVASIIAGVSVTARDNLKYTFASADIFRTRGYFPKMIAAPAETELPVTENPGLTFTLEHRMVEDAG